MARKKKIVRVRSTGNFNIGVVVFFIIIIYVIFNIFSYFTKPNIAEYQVQQGTIASNNIYQGIIIRDETVEYASRDGYINYYVKNASKVSVKDVIYSIDTEGDVAKKIAASVSESDGLSMDTLSSISTDLSTFVSDYNSNRFSECYTFLSNLSTEIAQDVNMNALSNLSSLVASAEDNQTFYQMTSPEDGIIVYEVDGFEDYSIEDVISSELNYNNYKEELLFAKEKVSSGDPVYKRINSEYWNIIVPIDEALAKQLSEKSAVRVRFCKDNFEIDTACSLLKEEESYYLNLSFNKGMIRYVNDRFVDIELVMGDKIGLKIPNSSITSKEFFMIPKEFFTTGDKPGLMIKQQIDGVDTTVLVHPTLYYETENYYYVDSEHVSVTDIIQKEDSSDTYIVGTDKGSLMGVYNINKGYAVFKQINIIYQNESYAIVETKTAYGIALYDHIALDASYVKENQLTTK